MQDFKEGQQIQLADGKTYLYINTISMDGHNYHLLSPKNEDKFIIGEMVSENKKRFFKIIQDQNLLEKIQKYYQTHPKALIIN